MRHLLILFLNGLQAEEYHKGYVTMSDILSLIKLSKLPCTLDDIFLSLADFHMIKCCGNGRYRIQFDPDKLSDEELDYILSDVIPEKEPDYISKEEWNAIKYLISKGYTIVKNK